MVARIDAPDEASKTMNSKRKERFKANKKARKAAAREAARVAMLILVRDSGKNRA